MTGSPVEHLRLLFREVAAVADGRRRAFAQGATGGGRLRYHQDVPVLTLRGEPRDMGLQHGRLLRDPILTLKKLYMDRFLSSYAAGTGGAADLMERSGRLGENLETHHREELSGLADGIGIAYEEALFLQTFLDLHKLYFCSTVVARSPEGRLLFGRNLDFPSMGVAHRFGVVINHRGEGRRPVTSVSWPGMLGSLTGMNDSGLSLAMMVVYFVEDVPEGMPYAMLFRRVLEEEETTAGVERRLRGAVSTNSNNLMTATGTGETALFEVRPSGIERREPAGGGLCSTNHFCGAGKRPFHPHPIYLSSYYRRWRLARRARGRPTYGDVRRALRLVAPPIANLQSMILLPEERAIALSMGTVPAARGKFTMLPRSVLFG